MSTSLLIAALRDGYLPGIVAKSIGDWVIVDQLWASFDAELEQANKIRRGLFRGSPQTPRGILRQIPNIVQQLSDRRDGRLISQIKRIENLIEHYVKRIPSSDTEHKIIAGIVFELITHYSELLSHQATADRDFLDLANIRAYQHFNLADKIRRLIISYARRSRYLY